ncbi:MAG: hypothetical protein ABIR51_05750 [Sphingomicrobium sp.]
MSAPGLKNARDKVTLARAEVESAKAALVDTARELQQRLQPKTLANDAWQAAKVKGADLAEDAVDAVKRRPVAAGGIVAALAMFLAREPIKDAAKRVYGAMTSSEDDGDKAVKKPVSPARRRARTPRRAPRKTEKVA